MVKLVLAVASFFSLSAFATTKAYDLKIDFSINGKHLSSPRIITKAGETATIIQENKNEKHFIELVADEGEFMGKEGILMNVIIGQVNKDGTRTTISTAKILTHENEKAEIKMGKDNEEELSLSLIVNRKSL